MSQQWTPHEYQRRAVEFMISNGSGALWLDPGMGKTAITLQAIKTLKHAGAPYKTLVVAPLRPMYSVWPVEASKWTNFENFKVEVLHGAEKDQAFKRDADIYAVNFDGLRWLSHLISKTGRFPFDVLVVDEISMLRNTRTQRFKTLQPMLDKFTRRYGLTGSPAPNSLMDVFGQQLIIDQGATFGRFITHFRSKYFFATGYGGYEWKLQAGSEEAIHAALDGKVVRLSALDYLDMPEKIINDVVVELPPDAKSAYDAVEADLMAAVIGGQVTASTAAVAIMKCQQIANGSVYIDGPERASSQVHDAKIEAVKDLVEERQGKPVMIAYHFGHDLETLKKAFPNAPVIGSGVVGKTLDDTINRWNNGEVPVLIGHPMSMGHGLNLQGVDAQVIWFSNTWSLELFDQFNARVWRQGQTGAVTVIHRIIAKDTVDESIVQAIARKESGQNSLLDELKKRSQVYLQ
jgi:SNF2 family DNA or RNA helicase